MFTIFVIVSLFINGQAASVHTTQIGVYADGAHCQAIAAQLNHEQELYRVDGGGWSTEQYVQARCVQTK